MRGYSSHGRKPGKAALTGKLFEDSLVKELESSLRKSGVLRIPIKFAAEKK